MDARELLSNLSDPDESVRDKAKRALGRPGEEQRAWAPDLIAALEHGSAEVRFWATSALGQVGPDPAQAVPALNALLSDPESRNRQAAALALFRLGPAAARDAVLAHARLLGTEDNPWYRAGLVEHLGYLAAWDADAISALIAALDDRDVRVRAKAAMALRDIGGRARAAVPALRRLLDTENEDQAVRSAREAVEVIESGAPVPRRGEPYGSISAALADGQFADARVPDAARRRLDQDDFEGALQLLEHAALEGDQDMFWLDLFNGARRLGLASQHRYFERYLETSGLGPFFRELNGVVRSSCPVSEGMQRMISHCSSANPDPCWERFYKLAIDEDLVRLRRWLEAAFTAQPPPDDIPGLWFGIVELDRGGQSTSDLYICGGQPCEEEPEDRVLGDDWQPDTGAYAHSSVLDEIRQLTNTERGNLERASYLLPLAYAALAVRWLVTTLPLELLLGAATQRLVTTGFESGDSIGIGTLRPDGLVFPAELRPQGLVFPAEPHRS